MLFIYLDAPFEPVFLLLGTTGAYLKRQQGFMQDIFRENDRRLKEE